jgi:hypothetical protein
MPLSQDTWRLFWVATTLKVKQALKESRSRERCPPNLLNEPSDTSRANVAAARRLLQLGVLSFGLLQDWGCRGRRLSISEPTHWLPIAARLAVSRAPAQSTLHR